MFGSPGLSQFDATVLMPGYGVRMPVRGTFRCYSMSIAGRPELEEGDKVLLPSSFFQMLTLADVNYPMQFRAANHDPEQQFATHLGVLEFTAPEGRAYLPHWVMHNLALEEGQLLDLTSVTLPKCTFVQFRPKKTEFIQLSNPKAVLEKHLPKFSCLTQGDTIVVPYQGKDYHLIVEKLRPGPAASIVETDMELEFAQPADYVEPVRGGGAAAEGEKAGGDKRARLAEAEAAAGGGMLVDAAAAATAATADAAAQPSEQPPPVQQPRKVFGVVPFSGAGRSTGGGSMGDGARSYSGSASVGGAAGTQLSAGGGVVGGSSSSSSSSSVSGASGLGVRSPLAARPKPMNRFEAARAAAAAAAFQGEGRSLSGAGGSGMPE